MKSCTIIPLLFCYSFLFAQIPQNNPINFKVNDLKAFSVNISFAKVKFATGYLVVRTTNATSKLKPLFGKKYERGDTIGDAIVVQSSLDTLIIPRAIRANTTYHFLVFSIYKVNGAWRYVWEKPLKIQVSTSGLTTSDYYESISTTAPNFISSLSSLLALHKLIPYTSYKNTILSMLELQDTLAGKTFVECVYSGERKLVEEPFDWTKAGYSREHTFAHSWMPSHPADNPPLPEYSDLHNLYPANLDKANTVRNNYPLGEVDGKVLYTYLEGKLGYSGNQIVYEPRDTHKGNAARAMMYMSIAYNNQNNWSFPTMQSQEIIKKWHFQDVPDAYEIARQEYIYYLQGNRNPFIDHPEYVCFIDFTEMSRQKANCYNSIQVLKNEPIIHVNLSNRMLEINSVEELSELGIYDLMGKLVLLKSKDVHANFVDLSNLKSGVFILDITFVTGIKTRKKIVLN